MGGGSGFDLLDATKSARTSFSEARAVPASKPQSMAVPTHRSDALGAYEARPGLRVRRGRDWSWGDQDGGWGSVGVITDGPRNGWCTVRWPSGAENGYRVGA